MILQKLIDIIKREIKLINKYWFWTTMMTIIYLITCVVDNMRFGYTTTFNLVSTNVWLAASIIILAMKEK